MSVDSQDQERKTESLNAAALALRNAYATYDWSDPEILACLDRYVYALHQSGKSDEAAIFEKRANLLRAELGLPETADGADSELACSAEQSKFDTTTETAATSSQPAQSAEIHRPVEQVEHPRALETDVQPSLSSEPTVTAHQVASADAESNPVEWNLYDSYGNHIAVEFVGNLYTLRGQHVGTWFDDLGAFLDRSGHYLAEVIEDNRLVRSTIWQYRQVSFGDRGYAGDRPGFVTLQDIEPMVLPRYFEDLVLGDPVTRV